VLLAWIIWLLRVAAEVVLEHQELAVVVVQAGYFMALLML
jgi:hypothetical protein